MKSDIGWVRETVADPWCGRRDPWCDEDYGDERIDPDYDGI